MTTSRRSLAVACGLALVVLVGGAPVATQPAAAEWAQWHGPSRDNKSTETGLLKAWPEGGPKLLWTGKGIGHGFSSIAVAGGMVYTVGVVSGKDMVTAFDLDGNRRWQVENGAGFTGDHPGSRGMPTVTDGLLYVMSGMGRLGCFDARTGQEKWAVDARRVFGGRVPRWGYAESPLVDGEKVICTPGGPGASVVALNRKTGETIWKSADLSDGASYCSAMLFELGGVRQLATMTASAAVGLAPDTGKLLWRYPHKTSYDVHATTLVYQTGSVYGSSGYGSGGFKLDLQVQDGAVQMTPRWTDKNLDNHHGGVILLDGHIYGYGNKGGWVCLDLGTGAVKYASKAFGKGSLTYADGMFYCLSEAPRDGSLALVKATPERFEVVSRFKVPPGGPAEFWAHPVVVGGRLYVRHSDNLYVYDVKAPA